eukprot:TRINITY_DN2324_c0_g1_i3.p1 TRINITY_DN2324_c0_g1~~TRINITY_DN2324_c0_g1_i3.p1  ORF type:complete len:277 (+),score=63.23 TRINITY_DN2324_c0_g1_i3:260-1090(+)
MWPSCMVSYVVASCTISQVVTCWLRSQRCDSPTAPKPDKKGWAGAATNVNRHACRSSLLLALCVALTSVRCCRHQRSTLLLRVGCPPLSPRGAAASREWLEATPATSTTICFAANVESCGTRWDPGQLRWSMTNSPHTGQRRSRGPEDQCRSPAVIHPSGRTTPLLFFVGLLSLRSRDADVGQSLREWLVRRRRHGADLPVIVSHFPSPPSPHSVDLVLGWPLALLDRTCCAAFFAFGSDLFRCPEWSGLLGGRLYITTTAPSSRAAAEPRHHIAA